MLDHKDYQSPFSARYTSQKMRYLFSPYFRATTWRKLWLSLAKAQKKLGLSISEEQLQDLEKFVEDIDFEVVSKHEKIKKHEVMAHIQAYGEQASKAKSILHLGATSCYLTDNGDLIQMKEGLLLIRNQLVSILRNLSDFAKKHADMPTLAYTHLQPAQPTTVGKRASLWLQDFLFDLEDLEYQLDHIYFLGAKGATGSQASFLALFDQDGKKVQQMDELISKEMGFNRLCILSSQTYSRKQDARVFSVLQGIASTAHKMANDIRFLCHFGEMQETTSKTQVGSSAMPHKKNPIYSERICGLARFVISLSDNPAYNAATQWLERTLDDSSNRRITLSEGFLATDAILQIVLYITQSWTIYPHVIEQNLSNHISELFLENVLMHATREGKDRQSVHHILHTHAQTVAEGKKTGKNVDMVALLAADKALGIDHVKLKTLMDTDVLIGRSADQVKSFLTKELDPILKQHAALPQLSADLEV